MNALPAKIPAGLLVAASLVASAEATQAQEEWIQPLTECGGLALVLQLRAREAAEAGEPTAQEFYQSALALFFQSLRLTSDVTECARPYEAVYDAMLDHGNAIRADYVAELENGASPSDIDTDIIQRVQQCRQTLGFETLMSAQGRIARDGVGCGWQP
ncbi:hypothetical protein [Gymnodinialimonas hymeniacidonis]|uniref:hypothetical protein n=1 Tax=Gymnodinialimonas hymeniacidonis TaxID=3126508 RepID=UPI0034C62704